MRPEPACGFTLIELMVTLAVVALLGVMTVPVLEVARQRQKEQELRVALRDIRNALDAYKKAADEGEIEVPLDASGYPPTLEVLVQGVPSAPTRKKGRLYFLRRVPRDPMLEQSDPSAAPSWGLRSYLSEPQDPHEGDDVYDVHSLSDKKGLNGVPYALW